MSTERRPRRRPEVLAPAGDPTSFRAALAAGADAVYLGMARFNARGRAERFRGVGLAACVRAAHARGARVYVTLNTLVHDDELGRALELAREAREAGADAAIVQDAGLASLLREELPGLPLHASTQMTVHQSDQAAEAVERLGLERIILARECTLEEAARIACRLRELGAEAEVFVHGALCFAYSGQCLMSNFAGRRSANRGICAQNCRFDYSAGRTDSVGWAESAGRAESSSFLPLPVFDRGSAAQLISMKDLAAFESVAALAEAGVGSFKIEGRLKGPSYVAEVVRLYRAALDAWEEGRPFAAGEAMRAAGRVYSRGFTNGYLEDRIDGSMRGDKRSLEGEPDGTVLNADRRRGLLLVRPRPGHRFRPGQGYRYAHQRYRGGFRVLGVDAALLADGQGAPEGGEAVRLRVRFGSEASGRRYRRGARGRLRLPPPLPVGLALHLNDDPELEREVEGLVRSVEISAGPEPVPITIAASGSAGEPLRLVAAAADGRSASADSRALLEAARGRPLEADLLAEHLGRLGGTAFRLEGLETAALATGVFLSFPALHALRRELVERLGNAPRSNGGGPAAPGPSWRLPPLTEGRRLTRIGVVAGSPEALRAALRAGAAAAAVEDPAALLQGGGERLEGWIDAAAEAGEVWFRLPPIVHREEDDRRSIETVARYFPRAELGLPRAGILAGHLGQLALAREAGLAAAADLYLNASNHRSLTVLRTAGARRVTLSLEVEAAEAARIAARSAGAPEVEVVAGGQVYSMLTRQPYGLAPHGREPCGREPYGPEPYDPEKRQRFLAVSEHGHPYRFEAAPGGTTTLYEARELVGAEALPLLAGRVDRVRLDLAHQPPHAVEEVVRAYREALEALLEEESLPPLRGDEREPLASSGEAPAAGSGAAAREAVTRAREAHLRHAPWGAFQGHLFRGARRQDAEEATAS